MICEQAMELMSAELDGALSEQDRLALEAHLDRCEECRRLRAAMASIDEQVAALAEPAPAGLKQGVMYRIEQESGKRKTPKRRFFGLGTGVGIVAAVLVLLVGTGVIRLPALSRAGVNSLKPASYETADNSGRKNDLTAASMTVGIEETYDRSGQKNNLPGQNDGEPSKGIAFSTDLISPNEAVPIGTKAPEEVDGEPQEDGHSSANPVSDQMRDLCASLAKDSNTPVLLYSEFSYDSLLDVLSVYAPELADQLAAFPVSREDGLVRCEADWQTVLAIQEWLLAVKPGTDADASELAGRMLEQMEALDPDSEYLYRVVTFRDREPEPLPLSAWPKTWPELWAERLLRQENWALFLPSEESSPRAADTAWLVFPDDR